MKKYIFAYMALAMSFIVSCSDNNASNSTPQNNTETITFAPFLDNGSIKVRSTHSTTDLAKGFVVGVYNKDYNSTSLPLKQRSTVSYNSKNTTKYTSSPTLYWDNVSADGHDVRLSEETTGAGSVNIWAANVAGHTCTIGNLTGATTSSNVFISDEGKLDWKIDADQKTSGSDKHDLLVADYITGQKAQTGAIKLCFHHAMTKITVNVIAGNGFATNEITNTNSVITLLNQNLKATVDLTKAKGDNTDVGMLEVSTNSDNIKDVTMHALSTANTVTGKTVAASFDAIVAEGKQLKASDQLGTIVIGTNPKTNTYKIVLDNEVLKSWNGGTEITEGSALTLKHGVHYILNITVNKQGIELTAVLADWTSHQADAVGQIHFTGTNTMISDDNAVAFNKPFTIYSKTTAADATYTAGSAFVWDKNDTGNKIGIYKLATDAATMYWADNADQRYFRSALYESASETTLANATIINAKVSGLEAKKYAETSDLIWGTSGTTAIYPTTQAVNLLFKHALSQVTVKLATTTGDDKIDLTKVKTVQLMGMRSKGGSMILDDGTIELATTNATDTIITLPNSVVKENETATTPAYTTSETWLVLPQSIDNHARILITMEDGSTFSANISAIHKATTDGTPKGMGQTSAAWLQNEKYEYTITLTKTKIDFAASVLQWTTATGAGNATMDWD